MLTVISLSKLTSTILFHIFLNCYAFPFPFLAFIGHELFTWLFESYIFISSFGDISVYLFLFDIAYFIKFVFLSKRAVWNPLFLSLPWLHCTVPSHWTGIICWILICCHRLHNIQFKFIIPLNSNTFYKFIDSYFFHHLFCFVLFYFVKRIHQIIVKVRFCIMSNLRSWIPKNTLLCLLL